MSQRIEGRVKFFNQEKGFGFITDPNGGPDVFVHINALKEAGIEQVDKGDLLAFQTLQVKKGVAASAIELIKRAEPKGPREDRNAEASY